MVKFAYIFLLMGMLWACKDETRENPPLKGNYFTRANPWKFYFVDAEGKSAIRLKPGAVLPTTDLRDGGAFEQAFVPEDFPETNISYLYNHNSNDVMYDADKGLYYWKTLIPGNEYVTNSEFYVHFNRTDIDTVRVKFKFIYDGVVGGSFVADITEMYYNEILVIKNDDYVSEEGIFIRK